MAVSMMPSRGRGARPPGGAGLAGLLVAMACALTGHRMLLVAVPWLVLSRTGSATQTGLVALAQAVPYLLTQVLAGPVIDRIGPRRMIIACTATSAVALLSLAVKPSAPIAVIAALMAVIGAADGPSTAAKATAAPAVLKPGQPIERVTSLTIAVERTATTTGPALAGLLITTIGGPRSLYVTAALFAAAALAGTRLPHAHPKLPGGSYLREFGEGIAFWRTDRTLRAISAMYLLGNLLDEALLTVLLPVWARQNGYGAAGVAGMLSIAGTAAVCASLLTAKIGHRLPRRITYLIGYTISGPIRFLALAWPIPLPAVGAAFAVAGIGSGLVNPLLLAVQYERVPGRLHGRVQTLIVTVARLGLPASGLTGAALLTATGLSSALVICAASYLAAVLAPVRRITWHHTPAANLARKQQ
jgi:MFS family permease